MREVRLIKRLEDLDGMVNGMGLNLTYDDISKDLQICTKTEVKMVTRDFEFIRCMGFEIRFESLRTKEEVQADMLSTGSFKSEECKTIVVWNKVERRYCTSNTLTIPFPAKIYFDGDVAHKFAKELNEILKINLEGTNEE